MLFSLKCSVKYFNSVNLQEVLVMGKKDDFFSKMSVLCWSREEVDINRARSEVLGIMGALSLLPAYYASLSEEETQAVWK